MNILVIGSSGFMGRHLVPHLESQGHHVIALTSKHADLTRQGDLEKVELPKLDCIYHLAAWTRAGEFCLHHGGEQWIVNQQINTNVLAWWQKKQPQAKLVAFGTSVSYTTEENLNEDVYMLGEPSDKFYAYAMSKRMLYAGLRSLHKQFGMNYLYLVPSTLYGEQYHTDGRELHFIYDLIRKVLLGKQTGSSVTLWGDGYQRRELVYAKDFVNILTMLSEQYSNDIFNIGAGEDYTIREFAKHICEEIGYDVEKIHYDTSGYVGAKSKCLGVKKLQAALPNVQMTPLKDGLKKTITWFVAEQEKFMPKEKIGR